ncbi:MAG: hypothetical protein HY720_33315 [Planctomycetes bacterium]|nr:hypothetical protein [Planctomycetota bacterium]
MRRCEALCQPDSWAARLEEAERRLPPLADLVARREVRDVAVAAGLDWLADHPPRLAEFNEFLEEMFLLALVAHNLRGEEAGQRALGLARSRLDLVRAEGVPASHQGFAYLDLYIEAVASYIGDHPGGTSAREEFVSEASRSSFSLKATLLAAALWPFLSPDQAERIRAAWRRDVAEGRLGISGNLPSLDAPLAWYEPGHEVAVLYAYGEDPVGVLPSAVAERLEAGFRRATLAFLRTDMVDVLSEVLSSYRVLAGAGDEFFERGAQYLAGLANEDGSFGPSPDLPGGRSDPFRHATLSVLWTLSIAGRDHNRSGDRR